MQAKPTGIWVERNRLSHILKKIDSIAFHKKYIRPDLRQAYELLISFYHNVKQQQYELHYIKRLLAIDKILNTEFKYLA